MLNLPSVYPAEACPEVTVYLVQLHTFYIKLTEKTTQRNCITDKGHWNQEQKTRQGRDGRPLDNEVKTMNR